MASRTNAIGHWMRFSLSCVALGCVLSAAPAMAGPDGAVQKPLDAEARKQVRSVARSLLVARRRASASPQAQQVRAQVGEVRRRIEALIAPVRQPPVVAAASADAAAAASSPTWRELRANDLQTLEGSLDSLDAKCRDLRAVRRAQPRSVPTQVSEDALQRLQRVRGELDTALQLPAPERFDRLRELARALEIRSLESGPLRKPEPSPAPAFRNRTQHR